MKNTKPRTKKELKKFYQEYLNGATIKEIDKKYNTDSSYQFRKYGFISRSPVSTKILRRKLKLSNISYNYEYDFSSISNEMEAYIVGFWFADGWCSSNNKQAGIKIGIKDINLIHKIKNYFSKDVKLQKNNISCGFVISDMRIVSNLIELGCLVNKTYKKLTVPKMDSSLIRHFIRGYFDADGTVYKDGNYIKCNICSINESFLRDLHKILLNNDIISTINIEIREGKIFKTPQGTSSNCKNMFRLFIRRKKDFKTFYNFLYKDSNIYLDRKFIKFNEGNTVLI